MNKIFINIILCFVFFNIFSALSEDNFIKYPITLKENINDKYFDTIVNDPYQWLETNSTKNIKEWIGNQKATTKKYYRKLSTLKYNIGESLNAMGDIKDIFNPFYNNGNYYFSTYINSDNLQPIIYIQRGRNKNPEVFINPSNIDISGLTSVNIISFSKDGKYVAVSANKKGSDWQEVWVYEIESGKKLHDKLQWLKFSILSWYNNGFFYTRFPESYTNEKYTAQTISSCIYYHKIGDKQEDDSLVYCSKSKTSILPSIFTDANEEFIFFIDENGIIKWKRASNIKAFYNLLYNNTNPKNTFNIIDVIDGKFLVKTNIDAPNGKIILIDPNNSEYENWYTLISEDKEAIINDVQLARKKIFIDYTIESNKKLFVFDKFGKNKQQIISVPGNIDISIGAVNDSVILYSFTSFLYPYTILEYNINKNTSDYYNKPEFSYVEGKYKAIRVWYKSKDSTKIPMYILYKKGIELKGQNPTLLYGYGGFGLSIQPFFSKAIILFLENGGVFAIPSLRGGGEFGDQWHEAGTIFNKQNTFDDMISAAEYLITNKYTSSQNLGIEGGSNGGLMVGACITQRPDLFKVAIADVGVMDMLRYNKFTYGVAWTEEYGAPNQSKNMFKYLLSYSPYHNLKPNTKYPATLILTADHDDRVVPAHSFKFAARLQEYNISNNPTILRIEEDAGHGSYNSGNKKYFQMIDKWSFFYWNLGIKKVTYKK